MAGEEAACGCNSSLECNICLDVAKEPVVTACGHLFCWPCLHMWLAQSAFCECPVCKGEVLRANITPIYGRGSEEGDSTTANPNLPPRPQANRRESLRQQLQRAGGNVTELESAIMQLIQNQQRTMGGLPTPAGTEMTSVNATQVVTLAAPQQSSSVEQLPTSSTATAIVDEPGPSRRSRSPSESPTIRSRRRPQ